MSKLNYNSAKKTKGRQRIEMKKMQNERNLQVTFSKRRTGLFKKASELCTLCGVDIAIIIFSPTHKVFSFGSPSVETIINSYHNWAQQPPTLMIQNFPDAHYTANVHDLNAHLTLINNEIEAEKNRSEDLSLLMQAAQAQLLWACPIGDMNWAQLDQLKTKLEALKELINHHTKKLLTLSATTTITTTTTTNNNLINQFYASSSSSIVNNATMRQPLSLQNPMLQSVKQEPSFDNVRGYGLDDRFY